MQLTSSAFANHDYLPRQFTCDGLGLSPPLTISGVLPGAKSLVLIVNDPDAPGGAWLHWLMWDIDPRVTDIPAASVPLGAIEGRNSFGDYHYGPPCPPSGIHRYQFKLYALNVTLADRLSPLATLEKIQSVMNRFVLEETQLTGLYSKH